MTFSPKTADQARDRARRVQAACAAVGHPRSLTLCQEAIAVAWGHRRWTDAVASVGRREYLPDERCDLPEVASRIERQVDAFHDLLELPDRAAAAVAYGARATSAQVPRRRQAVAMACGLVSPSPSEAIDLSGDVPPGCVRLWALCWEESERGWGTRPDGHSVHRSASDGFAYVRDYWARQPDAIPDEYSRPASQLYALDLPEDDTIAVAVSRCAIGTRLWQHDEGSRRLSYLTPDEAGGWRTVPVEPASEAGSEDGPIHTDVPATSP